MVGYTTYMVRRATSSTRTAGTVSYRLTRQKTVEEFFEGQHLPQDICDASAELRRVAHHCSTPMNETCPICSQHELVAVTFAFGVGLPASGRVLASESELAALYQRGKPATCYRIEVCCQCWWNYLRESFAVSVDQVVQ